MVDDFKLEKLKKLQEQGINPYPYSFKQKAHAEEIKKNYDKLEGKDTSVAGRALSIRHMGQLYFIDLLDQSGKIQVLAAANVTEKKSFDLLESIDSGFATRSRYLFLYLISVSFNPWNFSGS